MRLTHATEDVRRRRAERWLEQYGRIFYLTKQRRRGWQRRREREADQLFETARQEAGELVQRNLAEQRRSSPRPSRLRQISEQCRMLTSRRRHESVLRVAIGDPSIVLDNNLAERTLHPLPGGWTSSAAAS